MQVTIFKSSTSNVPQFFDVHDVLARIKRGNNKNLIAKIRAQESKEKRDSLKMGLIWICFSGKFKTRHNDDLIEHSGLMCLDFDGFPNAQELSTWRSRISKDKYTFALFTSPSGNGLKVLVKIPKCKTNSEHNLRFDALHNYWKDCKYFDKNVKGVVRVCYESYDPNIYINDNSTTYIGIKKEEVRRKISLGTEVESDYKSIFDNLIVWFEKSYNLTKGNRNVALFSLVSACRDYDIPIDEADRLVKSYVVHNAEEPQSIIPELKTIFKSSYSRPSANKKMKIMETETRNVVDDSIEIDGDFYFDDEPGEEELIIEEDTEEEEEQIPNKETFWRWANTSYKIDFMQLKMFLQKHGFYRYELSSRDFSFVKVNQNTVEIVGVRHIKEFLLNCLSAWNEVDIFNMIAENTKFKKEYLDYLDPIKINWNKDTKDYGWIYFKNTAVKVSKDNIELVNYIDLDGFIWKTQKLNRDFKLLDKEKAMDCDFAKFVSNISANDNNRIKSFNSGVGYLLHSHKSKSTAKAVIFNDEIIAEEAMGGTGKGLTMQIIGTMKNVVIIPGADFNTGKDFAWQRVGLDTDVVLIDDVEKNFKYKKLFTFITDGWPVRKLYQDEVFLAPEDSPKVVINTNYTLKGDTDSYARRKFELELHPHYSRSYQPIDDFKREFVTEWPKDEQNRCDNYLLYCLSAFLDKGLIEPKYINLKIKKLIVNTNRDFVAFAEDALKNNMRCNKKDVLAYYKREHGIGTHEFPNQKVFTIWLNEWGKHNGWETNVRSGSGGVDITYGDGSEYWSPPGTKELVF